MGVTVERNGGVTVKANRNAPKEVKEIGVERLLHWAYSVERVRGAPSWSAEGADMLDVGGCGGAAGSGCHPDALIVDRVVTMLSPMAATLVRDHALTGTRPDWRPHARHRFEALNWINIGENRRIAECWTTHPESCSCGGAAHLCKPGQAPLGRLGERAWAYCPVVAVDHPDEVMKHRLAFYVPWVAYLEVIRDALRAPSSNDLRLTAHSVTDLLPVRLPWLERLPVGRVIFPLTER